MVLDLKFIDDHFSKIAVAAIFFFGTIGLGVRAGFKIIPGSAFTQSISRGRFSVIVYFDLPVRRQELGRESLAERIVGVKSRAGLAIDIYEKLGVFQANNDNIVA